MYLYTSDLHFGHRNVIGFDQRPFSDVDEMDHCLMDYWNFRVRPDDTVYIVGDFCYRSEKSAAWYLRQLKGHKVLIQGNHDGALLKEEAALSYFDDIQKMMHVTDGERNICLCHFPIAEWNGYYHESWHIYGHIHNRKDETFEIMKKKKRALNAGCMINGYVPVSFDELLKNNELFKENDAGRISDWSGK